MVGFSEPLLPGPVAVENVTGDRVHYSTFFRWTQRGVQVCRGKRVRLDFIKAGSKRLTSEAAVRRFFEAVTNGVASPMGASRGRLTDNADDRLIDEELSHEGI